METTSLSPAEHMTIAQAMVDFAASIPSDDGRAELSALGQVLSCVGRMAARIAGAHAETRVSVRLRYRDLNARGRGSETFRRAILPRAERGGWATELAENVTGEWSRGTYLASDRRCAQTGELPVGTIIVDYECSVPRSGPASVRAGVLCRDKDGDAAIVWGLRVRKSGETTTVTLPDGRKVVA